MQSGIAPNQSNQAQNNEEEKKNKDKEEEKKAAIQKQKNEKETNEQFNKEVSLVRAPRFYNSDREFFEDVIMGRLDAGGGIFGTS